MKLAFTCMPSTTMLEPPAHALKPICSNLRCHGIIYSILAFALYGPALITTGLAIWYFTSPSGSAAILSASLPEGAGVVMAAVLTGVDSSQGQITIRWSVGAYGSAYAVLENGIPAPSDYVGFLSRPANFLLDRQLAKSYDPTQVINRVARSSSATQFSMTSYVDGFNSLPARRPLQHRPQIPRYIFSLELRVTETLTNASLPLAENGVLCFSAFVGWEISSCRLTNVGTATDPLVYVVSLEVKVDRWKSLNEQAMSYILVVLSFVAFGMTWRNIMYVWTGIRPRSISDLLTMPLGIAGAAGAVRAVFPADSPFQMTTDEGFYYPLIVLLVWCAVVAVLMTSASAVRLHEGLSAWSHSCEEKQQTCESPKALSALSLEEGTFRHRVGFPRAETNEASGYDGLSRENSRSKLSIKSPVEPGETAVAGDAGRGIEQIP